jgi:general nucleoside transport system ATP-binding protein
VTAAGGPPALELRGISKRFGATQALDGVDLCVRSGSVHVVLGENGAGKSTLMHIAYGQLSADNGAVRVHGVDRGISGGSPRAGLGMVHQHLSLVPTMTAVENYALGGSGLLHPARGRAELERLASASGLTVPFDAEVREMTIVEQQHLEILKALGGAASVLIMDEPTAVLTPAEVRDVLAWIRSFVTRGGSVVLVTHKLREALTIADDMTVLRRGRVVWAGQAAGTGEAQLAAALFPEMPPSAASATPRPRADAGVCVRADMMGLRSDRGAWAVRDATFEIRRGDIVGIAAVEGAGHRELLRALAGRLSASSGTLVLPREVAFIPADRRREGLVVEFSLTENVALRGLGTRRGIMPWPRLRKHTLDLIERFGITAESADARVATLSGGNQQRLVIARELDGAVELVVADNPTRGLDLSATTFMHGQLRLAAAGGAAVVVHSSDLDEVLTLATRVLVVFHGSVREVVSDDREAVGRAMLGVA